jgi:hypothetical protein
MNSSIVTFRDSQYTITTSLNERAIYIKIINNLSYMCYESNFDVTAFKLPFGLEDIYKLVNKCFAEPSDVGYETGYSVLMELDNSMLRLEFQCVVGGFLNIVFDLFLREKLMSNDAQLTINFQRVEQKQQQTFEQLTKRMEEMERQFKMQSEKMAYRLEALGHANICFTKPPSGNVNYILSFPIGSKTLSIENDSNSISNESFEKIKYFYQLEELKLYNCQWQNPERYVSNKTVKKLTINSSQTFRDISFIKNFPSLEELTMESFAVDASIVTTLRSITHKIKKLTFTSCTGINQTEMQTYCTQTGIQLNLS